MWKWLNCYLSGRHDFGMWCEPGAIFLRCVHCGKRSSGWTVDPKTVVHRAPSEARGPQPTAALVVAARSTSRILPFERVGAR
ncbi:MAG TPA: hypothetical protein VH583_26205 [Vicinamibacterales bacterium]|jgi:hypothetical protein